MTRLAMLKKTDLDAEQMKLHEALTGGERAKAPRKFPLENPDGSLNGPFNALLYRPVAGNAWQKLGGLLRFESALPGSVREVAILTVGRHWRANYEWYAHSLIAEREGVDAETIAAIKEGREPDANEDWALVNRSVKELLESKRMSDATYKSVVDRFGDAAAVELVMLAGYYCMVSALLNAFEVDMPPGEAPPFGD